MSENTQLKEMSTEELKALLQKREKEEALILETSKKEYETQRDKFVGDAVKEAINISAILKDFKDRLHQAFDEHQKRLDEYGQIRGNSKGGFSITTTDGRLRAKRLRSTVPSWDERSQKAVELISDFLRDTVRKRDRKLFDILISFIQRNEKGELEYAKVMHLLQHKDKYNDARWQEGLRLIQESYNLQLRGYGYEFYVKDAYGNFDKVEINFTAL